MLLGEIFHRAAGRGAGVVDEDVDPPQRRVRLFDETLRVGRFGEVGRDRDDLAVGGTGDLGGGCLQRFLAACADRNIDTFMRQREAIALPMPSLAPVTSAALPFIRRSMGLPVKVLSSCR
jgi:hypothetical protein